MIAAVGFIVKAQSSLKKKNNAILFTKFTNHYITHLIHVIHSRRFLVVFLFSKYKKIKYLLYELHIPHGLDHRYHWFAVFAHFQNLMKCRTTPLD